jgi:tRNA1Val (adenine37-N6)-methyltransferase
MPNTFFQFKQFTIHQDQCAMKVSTDSCLFGAWLSKIVVPSLPNINNVLDIGAGTGLLMLMMAQEHMLNIDGIELNDSAYQQALNNISLSKWTDRLRLLHGDVKTFHLVQQYDFIISNPPFYENDLLTPSKEKAAAMHDATLDFDSLLSVINKHLNADGFCALLIPFHRFNYFKDLSLSKGFYVQSVMHIRHQEDHQFIRSMVLLGREYAEPCIDALTIKEKDETYTSAFADLLRDYYLYL